MALRLGSEEDISTSSLPDGDGGEGINHQQTTLHYAAKRGHVDVVRMLVDECKKPINSDGFLNPNIARTPILFALFHGPMEVARY